MTNLMSHIKMRTKVIYLFKSDIRRGADEIVDYSMKLTSPPSMFTSLEETQTYIAEFEQNWLDLETCLKSHYPPQNQLRHRMNNKAN